MFGIEKFQPKELIKNPDALWTTLVRSINYGSNRLADIIKYEIEEGLLSESRETALYLNRRNKIGYTAWHIYFSLIEATSGLQYSFLEAIARKTGGRHNTEPLF